MTAALARFTQEEFEGELQTLVADRSSSSSLSIPKRPRAVLLGGQSGAGKTTLHSIYRDAFKRNVIIINGDEYRSFHPHYRELDQAYGPEAVAYTAAWAGKMTEALIDEFSLAGYNLIIEGTLRTSEVPVKTATLLRARGYGVSLALMAVKPEISLVSCQVRYELMRIAGTVPRATDPRHHDKIVRDIVGNLSALEQTGLFDEVCLYARSRERLYPVEGETRTASEALREVLFGPWTREEKEHYAHLEEELAKLKKRP
ncbi:zeta toxin family protein [Adlercreutzia sp. ZJ242]|uniref:zeta toxin family protein n=1 Tax=Adlercreutzia sp. ZJ242 TaxID=2709409 RepID=UPI0013EBFCA1|nr:zeta toxin family protein [Adlercreutzia sp. ZJ242]